MDENKAAVDFIDSVKEVDIKIRSHRSDDDFEKMLAELNGKKEPDKQSEAPKEAESKSEEKPIKQESKPEAVKAEKPRHDKPDDIKTVPPAKAPAKKLKEEEAEGKEQTEDTPQEELESSTLAARLESIWQNPDLSDGGRVAVKINTDLRKEIKINVSPKAAAEEARDVPPPQDSRSKRREPAKPAKADSAVKKAKTKADEKAVPQTKKTPQKKHNKASRNTDRASVPASAAVPMPAPVPVPAPVPAPVPRPAAKRPAAERSGSVKKKKNAADRKKEAARQRTALIAKKYSFVNIAVCAVMFFGIGLFLVIAPRESGFIDSENRNLAEMPELTVEGLIDGSYFTDLTEWYTDTIPGREELKSFSSTFSKLFGINLGDVKITGDISPVQKEVLDEDTTVTTTAVSINTDFDSTSKTTTTTKKETTVSEELVDVPEVLDDGEWMGSVIVSGTGENVRAMSAFYGTFDMGQKYAETINKYRDSLDSSINIYTMNMPSAAAYYMPSNMADDFTSQHDCITNIGNNLSGIVNIDVYDVLDEHKDEYIYARTDHHWMPLGAYYATQVFAETALVDYAELSSYEECVIEDFVGTMYAYSDYDEELNENPDTFTYYKPSNSYTVTYYDSEFTNGTASTLFFDFASGVNCYSAILGNDDEIAEIETDCDNGRVLVIFKDSFGNAIVPFLTGSFEKIYVCDFRYFDINAIDFINEVGCTDLLFAISLQAAHTESHINTIGNIRIQNPAYEENLPEEYIPGETDDTDDDDDGDTDGTEETTGE